MDEKLKEALITAEEMGEYGRRSNFSDTRDLRKSANAYYKYFIESLRESGFVIAPVEATNNMLEAAWRLHDRQPATCAPSDIWRAMLAAAQEPGQ